MNSGEIENLSLISSKIEKLNSCIRYFESIEGNIPDELISKYLDQYSLGVQAGRIFLRPLDNKYSYIEDYTNLANDIKLDKWVSQIKRGRPFNYALKHLMKIKNGTVLLKSDKYNSSYVCLKGKALGGSERIAAKIRSPYTYYRGKKHENLANSLFKSITEEVINEATYNKIKRLNNLLGKGQDNIRIY